MCCRYWTDVSPELRPIVEAMNCSPLTAEWQKSAKIITCGEVRPTDVVPVIAPNREGRRAVSPMKWGFSGRSLLINARAETAAAKPTFRDAWERHRCVIPASWYFEWEHRGGSSGSGGKIRAGDRYRIRAKGSSVTWLGGLYRIEYGLPVFVVLTCEPAEELRFLHDRMPLLLPEELIDEWIRPDRRAEDMIGRAVTDVICEKAAE